MLPESAASAFRLRPSILSTANVRLHLSTPTPPPTPSRTLEDGRLGPPTGNCCIPCPPTPTPDSSPPPLSHPPVSPPRGKKRPTGPGRHSPAELWGLSHPLPTPLLLLLLPPAVTVFTDAPQVAFSVAETDGRVVRLHREGADAEEGRCVGPRLDHQCLLWRGLRAVARLFPRQEGRVLPRPGRRHGKGREDRSADALCCSLLGVWEGPQLSCPLRLHL